VRQERARGNAIALDDADTAMRRVAKEEGHMIKHLTIAVAGAVLLAVAAAASTVAWASEAEKTTYLTFNRSVAIPGAQLDPGTYIFELASPGTSFGSVRVSNRNRSKVYLMAFTRSIGRPAGLAANHLVLLDEASQGEAPAVRAWFPQGANQGYEFIYGN
jgi:hypothetical protein